MAAVRLVRRPVRPLGVVRSAGRPRRRGLRLRRADYDAYSTVLVWVEADRDERIRRGVARDGEQVLERWFAWMESEQVHFAHHETRERADLRLTTA